MEQFVSISAALIDEIAVANQLGEGIQWRIHDSTLWWTDILACQLFCYHHEHRTLNTWLMPEPLASFAFTRDPNIIVAAMASGFAFYDLTNRKLDWIAQPQLLPGESRFNDGRADRQGRFWSGTMMVDPDNYQEATGRLFKLDTDLTVSTHENNMSISNGLCWSPDSRIMYFADSLTGEMLQYGFDAATGYCSNRQTFAQAIDGASPDGAVVDIEGNLWSAQWGIGQVHAYSPGGNLLVALDIPTTQPTCVAFGGEKSNLLFVSSATDGLSSDQLSREPSAGNVFIYETNTQGIPEAVFGGSPCQARN